MAIKYCSAAIIVRDMGAARKFYEGVLGQKVEFDHGQCVSFVGGFALWELDHASRIIFGKEKGIKLAKHNHAGEMYFETEDLDEVFAGLKQADTAFVHEMYEQPWGQRAFRVYDPDGHIVEIGEPMPAVILRFLKQGMAMEATATRTSMPVEIVQAIAAEAGIK